MVKAFEIFRKWSKLWMWRLVEGNLLTISNALLNAFFCVLRRSRSASKITKKTAQPGLVLCKFGCSAVKISIDTRIAISSVKNRKRKWWQKRSKFDRKCDVKGIKMNEAKSISLPSSSPHPSIIERLFKLIQLNCFSVSEEKKNQRSDVGGEKKSHRCRATFLRSKKKKCKSSPCSHNKVN